MNEVYKMACTEVVEALKYIPLEEYHKIPKKVLEFMEENKDTKYNYKYDVENPKMSRQANMIITKLYLDYIANEKEKKIINEILLLNSKKQKSSYTNNVFKPKKESKSYEIKNEKHNLPVKKENVNWLKKLINKIKLIFVKRKS